MADYSFVTRWRLDAPLEAVFAQIDDSGAWPSWWPGVRRVEVLEPGAPGGIGKVLRTTWRSKLPYDLTFDSRVVRREPPHTIEVVASGELEGRGRWELARDGTGTVVTYHWQVATNKAWMNWLAPIMKPFFRWNHDVIMGWGGEALARRLAQTPRLLTAG